jgi:5-methylcytosine-specific restriction endonuclease McrA
VCDTHGESGLVLDAGGALRCKQCRAEAVSRRRRRVKAILVAEAGGKCCICGYDRNLRALHFHHVEPHNKRLGIGARGLALAIDTLRAEARKCVLLCSNCHAEVEDGDVSIPLE